MFDWANSVYALVISTAVFPPYFAAQTDEFVQLFGMSIKSTALYSFTVSAAYLFMAILIPFLSGMADYGNKKLFFLRIFTLLGGLSCISMFFFNGNDTVVIGCTSFALATIGFGGGIVFYNAFLPQIATPDRHDMVSAKGYTYGYIGSVICLIIILAMVMKPDMFGMSADSTLPVRLGFIIVGIWWIVFAEVAFRNLPSDTPGRLPQGIVSKGISELKIAFDYVRGKENIRKFLISYFFYIAGVNTVIYTATIFGNEELKMETSELVVTVLIIQLVAICGAYLFAALSKYRGNKFAIMTMLFIWIGLCIGGYYCQSKMYFYCLSGGVGLVIGGIQSLSRSSYSKMLTDELDEVASFFSFYDVLTKVAVVSGTLIYGLVDAITGNLRYSVLSIAVFFIVAMLLMINIRFYPNEERIN